MPLLLNLRALCAPCERAEATHWCAATRTALCANCLARRPRDAPRAVPIVPRSVVAALCASCAVAPAAFCCPREDTPLCEICARAANAPLVPLRDACVADGLVFDKMDFSGSGRAPPRPAVRAPPPHIPCPAAVDLTYYKTPVPMSLVNSARKRRPASHPVSDSPPSMRKRSASPDPRADSRERRERDRRDKDRRRRR